MAGARPRRGAGTGPVGIVFDSSGNAYVLDQTTKQVVEFSGGNLSGTGTALTGLGLNAATGIAIDASNIQNYVSGIFSCSNFTAVNHGVVGK